jgi:hypothetical protein
MEGLLHAPNLHLQSNNILVKFRQNDPRVKVAVIDSINMHSIVSALTNNTVVDTIRFQNDSNNDVRMVAAIAAAVDYTPLLHLIRTRSQLRNLILEDFTRQFDASEFLQAAAQNKALRSLKIAFIMVYTSEALRSLRHHPNLQEFSFSISTDIQERGAMIQQIIQTCPKLSRLRPGGSDPSREAWQPIFDALGCPQHLPPQRAIKLWMLDLSWCNLDQRATELLRTFLNESPNPLHLCVHEMSVKLPPQDNTSNSTIDDEHHRSSWLAFLVGPSVRALTINYENYGQKFRFLSNWVKPDLDQLMKTLQHKHHQQPSQLQTLQLEQMHSTEDYQAILGGIREITCLKTIQISFSLTGSVLSNTRFSHVKQQMLQALSENMSITKVNLQFCPFQNDQNPELIWTEPQRKRLEYLRQRNETFSRLDVSSARDSLWIPLSVWPAVLQDVPKTHTGANFTFQALRNILLTFTRLLLDTGSESDESEELSRGYHDATQADP